MGAVDLNIGPVDLHVYYIRQAWMIFLYGLTIRWPLMAAFKESIERLYNYIYNLSRQPVFYIKSRDLPINR
jgi:hypothetical protein